MIEQEQQPIKWEKGQNDLEYFGSLSFPELTKVLEDEEVAVYYATKVTYRQESRVYRPNPDSLSGDGFDVRPETKIIFTVGDGVNSNMRLAKDFSGAGVRTKKSDGRNAEADAMALLQLANYKAAECDEVRATVSFYIDGENNVNADMAFAEISDIFYNLFHLETTDPENIDEYHRWESVLLETLGLTKTQIIKMIAAKYHFRLFKNLGHNGFGEEDQNISLVLNELYGFMDEMYGEKKDTFLKERASNFLTVADIAFERLFKKRLQELKKQFHYDKNEIEDKKILPRIPLPEKIKIKIGQLLRGKGGEIEKTLKHIVRGETKDPIFELSEEELMDLARMAGTIMLIISRAKQYPELTQDQQTTK